MLLLPLLLLPALTSLSRSRAWWLLHADRLPAPRGSAPAPGLGFGLSGLLPAGTSDPLACHLALSTSVPCSLACSRTQAEGLLSSAQLSSARLVWVLALGSLSLSHFETSCIGSSRSLVSHNSTLLIQLVSGPFVSQLPLSSALLSARLLFLFSVCLLSVSFSSQFIFSFSSKTFAFHFI